MIRSRSLLIGAALALFSSACSESPAAPASASSSKTISMPSTGPMFTDGTGTIAGNPPPGGVTQSESGDPGSMTGRTFNYSNLQNGMFDVLAWGKGNSMAIAIFSDGMPTLPTFVGVQGPEAVWSAMITVGGAPVTVRITASAPGILPTTDLATLGIDADAGAVFVPTGSSFQAVVHAYAVGAGGGDDDGPAALIPLSQIAFLLPGYSGPLPTVSFFPSFFTKLKSCNAGYYLTGDGCVAAPAGSYAGGGSGTSATQCPSGTYQPDAGQNTCLSAPRGSYAEGPGATEALLCPVGYYTDVPGRSSCIAAQKGKYVDTEGATFATPCAAGTYNNSTAQTSCNTTPAGYYSPAGAFTPTQCGAGYYSSSSGSSSCTAASAGYYAPGPHDTYQTQCAVGTFSSTSGASSCAQAPAGSYVPVPGATGPTQCSPGYYQPLIGQTSCIAASVGYYVGTNGSAVQTPCPLGTEATSTGSASCTPISPLATLDALIATAQGNPDVGKGDLNKLIDARKKLLQGKTKDVCKALDDFAKYVTKESAKKKNPLTGGALLLQQVDLAEAANGC